MACRAHYTSQTQSPKWGFSCLGNETAFLDEVNSFECQSSQWQPLLQMAKDRHLQIHTHQKCSKMVAFSCSTLDIYIKAASSSFESQIECLHFKRPAYEEHRDCRASLHSIFSTINERRRPGLWYVYAVIMRDHRKRTLSKVPPCCAPVSRHGCHGGAFSISGCLISACGCM